MTQTIALLLFATFAGSVNAADLHVLTSNGVKAATEELYPQSEKTTGAHVAAEYATTTALRKKAEEGGAFDAAILTSDAMDALIKAGKIVPDSRKLVGKAGIGVGYHTGNPKPDVHNADALKKTLLSAKSITYNEVGASKTYIEKMFVTLGVADQIKSKIILEKDSGKPQLDVGEGKAEIVLTLVPEILPYKGVELAGPLPEDLQNYITFEAGVSANTSQAQAAQKFVAFVASPSHKAFKKSKGLTTP
jgi:molybdate transport system substrate-binding protein